MGTQGQGTLPRVVVTVVHAGEAWGRDLEVPSGVPSYQLAALIARGLGWNPAPGVVYLVEAHPPGRALRPDESLAEAAAWDGAWLILHPVVIPVPVPTPATSPSQGPLVGWRPLGLTPPGR